MRRFLATAAVLGLIAGASGQARAELITFTETAIATGTLGGTPYINALITLTSTADTTAVTENSGFFSVINTSATVDVPLIGTAAFAPSSTTFDNQTFNPPAAGIASGGFSILDTFSATFGSYDLKSSIGPIVGPAFINSNEPFSTSMGDFIITSVSGDVTFTAVLQGAVPEPGTFGMAGTAVIVGLGASWYRKRRRIA